MHAFLTPRDHSPPALPSARQVVLLLPDGRVLQHNALPDFNVTAPKTPTDASVHSPTAGARQVVLLLPDGRVLHHLSLPESSVQQQQQQQQPTPSESVAGAQGASRIGNRWEAALCARVGLEDGLVCVFVCVCAVLVAHGHVMRVLAENWPCVHFARVPGSSFAYPNLYLVFVPEPYT
eukprot:1158669-Pelagomonas_calceolata.AAC.6